MQTVNLVNKNLQTGKPAYLRNKLKVIRRKIKVRSTRQDLLPIAPAKDKAGNGQNGIKLLWTEEVQCFATH